jgi:hypothetical protein
MKIDEIEKIRRLIQYAFRESVDLEAPTVRLLLGMTLEELDELTSGNKSVMDHQQVISA